MFNFFDGNDMPQQDRKIFYHGTKTEILGGYLRPNKAFNSVQDKICSGAFATTDLNHAKFFAINSCLSGNGHTQQDGKKVFLERLSSNIKTRFFVYSLYEMMDNPFIHDSGTEYYALKPVKIASFQTFNIAEEIKNLGYEVYVLNEPLKSISNMSVGNNFDVRAEMADAIEKKLYHRVDVDAVIKQQQSQSLVYRIFRNVFQRD